MAHILRTDIYTYDVTCSWYHFSAKDVERSAVTCGMGIYLKHTHRVHYDVVLSVHELSPETLDMNEVREDCSERSDACDEYTVLNDQSTKQTLNTDIDSKQSTERPKRCKVKRKKQVNLVKRRELARKKYQERKMKKCDKYKTDVEFRKAKKAKCKNRQMIKYRTDKTYRTQVIDSKKHASKVLYHESKKHRATKIESSKTKYRDNVEFRKEVMNSSTMKYKENEEFRKEVVNASKMKYKENEEFRGKVRNASKMKYHNDENFKNKVINVIKFKYRSNPNYNKATINSVKTARKYHVDDGYRNKLIEASKSKYHENEHFRKNVIDFNKKKYKSSASFRQNITKNNTSRAMHKKMNKQHINKVLSDFKKEISNGPEFVCAVCMRLLFRKQVIKCNKNKYNSLDCISEEYVHNCNEKCTSNCVVAKSSRSSLWMCHTCDRKLLNDKIPAEACSNNLHLADIPEELAVLNKLEEHLIALNIPFVKLMALPKGGQLGIRGPVVCVPYHVTDTVKSLPRPECEDQMIRVKLKRK